VQERPLTLETLTDETREVAIQVHNAQERLEDREYLASTQTIVESLGRRYREFYDGLPPGEQLKVERALGRRIQDIKRLAGLLPRVLTTARESTPDRQVHGVSSVGERRITGVSWSTSRAAPQATLSVGGEIEAWCGKCGESTTHHIFAIVGGEPKQVICQVCNSRHAYRTEPARKKVAEAATASAPTSGGRVSNGLTPKQQAQNVLQNELAAAGTVRTFDPKERYRVGDIIDHPEHGRGKVENVLRSSLLVRFGRVGLRPLSLY